MISEAKKKADKKYNNKAYQSLTIKVRRDDNICDILTEHCARQGISKAEFIKKAIINQIALDEES